MSNSIFKSAVHGVSEVKFHKHVLEAMNQRAVVLHHENSGGDIAFKKHSAMHMFSGNVTALMERYGVFFKMMQIGKAVSFYLLPGQRPNVKYSFRLGTKMDPFGVHGSLKFVESSCKEEKELENALQIEEVVISTHYFLV